MKSLTAATSSAALGRRRTRAFRPPRPRGGGVPRARQRQQSTGQRTFAAALRDHPAMLYITTATHLIAPRHQHGRQPTGMPTSYLSPSSPRANRPLPLRPAAPGDLPRPGVRGRRRWARSTRLRSANSDATWSAASWPTASPAHAVPSAAMIPGWPSPARGAASARRAMPGAWPRPRQASALDARSGCCDRRSGAPPRAALVLPPRAARSQ
jgi:hypothetical protein